MATKKKSTKKNKKPTIKTIIAVLFIVAILAVGLLIAPMIPALEGKVYSVNLVVNKKEVTLAEGESLNLTYEAEFDYLGVFNQDLKDSVEIVYYDEEGNAVQDLTKSGTYKAIYTVKYRGTTKTSEVVIKVKPKVEGSAAKLEFHFIDPTSEYTYAGDAVYIKAGDTDILIDAGPRKGSAGIIEQYIDQYCTDKILEYVIATHADQDHIAGFVGTTTAKSIFEYYTCEVFIDFNLSDNPLTTNKGNPTLYANYITKRDAAVNKGMKHYTALDCWNETNGAQKTYQIAEGITMSILYNYYYENKSSDENNYSVCVLFTETVNNKYFLFTGDLEEKGEEYLVQYNNLPEVDLFKAGHHGSPTSSNDVLLEVIKPKIAVFTGVAGLDEYTKDIDRIFPSTFAINRIAKYTDKMYCLGCIRNGNYEALNGTTIVTCENGVVSVNCLNNNTLLKDSWWFNSDVEYYNTTNSNGAVQMLLDSKHPTADGTRKWRTWPE